MFSAMGNRLVTGAINKAIRHSKKKSVKNHIDRDKIVSEYMTELMNEIRQKGYGEVWDTAVRECIYWYIEREVEWKIDLQLY